MAAPQLLWRKVLAATIDTLRGNSRGQYDIRLAKPAGIHDFFAGLPREATELGGYTVQVPLAPAAAPIAVPATSIEVAYIGPESARDDWRIPSQRPTTAYPLWRLGVGLKDSTEPGDDFVILVRDPADAFHARWLRHAELDRVPSDIRERMGTRTAGIEVLSEPEWAEVAALLGIEALPGPTEPLPTDVAAEAGEAYRPEDEDVATAQPDPFKVDPDVLDRGISGHRKTQNAFAQYLEDQGLTPLSHRPNIDPAFDVAWREGDTLLVAEVKSMTSSNQEKQLRLALGQVLRYAHQLRAGQPAVVPVIVVESEPADPTWAGLCADLGVRLAWPGAFDRAVVA